MIRARPATTWATSDDWWRRVALKPRPSLMWALPSRGPWALHSQMNHDTRTQPAAAVVGSPVCVRRYMGPDAR